MLRARAFALAALGAALALAPALALRGFTVDDALISARYAAHLARGLGYRFNEGGPVTDGVTPLGFPYLLAPFARSGPLAALAAAKVLGVLAWTAAAAVLALAVGSVAAPSLGPSAEAPRRRPPARFSALLLLAVSAPLGAWSVAGMETGLVIALAALAVALRQLDRPRGGALAAGIAAALRPELTPWALVVGAAPRPSSAPPRPFPDRTLLLRLALSGFPPALCAALRFGIFGRPVPLAVLAKPSTPELGLKYALACFLLTGPLALLAPLAIRRVDGFARALLAAIAAHFAAVALAGGDWMPLSRLVAPVLPTVVLAAAHLAAVADRRATAARLGLALAGELFQLVRVGPSAAAVGADRLQVIADLRAPLADARVVAALDIGWLGAATSATIVDLAGLTDPAIAALKGGHTSKAIPVGLLDARKVDALVLLLAEGERLRDPWTSSFFARQVELRIASIPHVGEAFAPVAPVDHAQTARLDYVVLRRVEPLAPR